MTRVWMGVPLALAFGGATLLAQAGSQQPSTQTPTSQSQSQSITVTGCLQSPSQAGTPGATGTAGTAAGAAGQWRLTNATKGSPSGAAGATTPSGSAPGATAGAGAAAGSKGAGMTYVLEGRSDELAKHAGHQIEVTGTLAPSSGAGSSPSGATGTAGAAGATPSAGAGAQQRLQVSSVRMLSANCPPQ
jgi:hypothetical protein